jgi:hypothetical protein
MKALFTLLLRKTGRRVAVAESMRMAFAQKTLILFLSLPGVIPQATMNRGFAQKRRRCPFSTRTKSSQAAKLFNVCNTENTEKRIKREKKSQGESLCLFLFLFVFFLCVPCLPWLLLSSFSSVLSAFLFRAFLSCRGNSASAGHGISNRRLGRHGRGLVIPGLGRSITDRCVLTCLSPWDLETPRQSPGIGHPAQFVPRINFLLSSVLWPWAHATPNTDPGQQHHADRGSVAPVSRSGLPGTCPRCTALPLLGVLL